MDEDCWDTVGEIVLFLSEPLFQARKITIFGNELKNSWWFLERLFVIYRRNPEGESGSAEEQPASNRDYHEEYSPGNKPGFFLSIFFVYYDSENLEPEEFR